MADLQTDRAGAPEPPHGAAAAEWDDLAARHPALERLEVILHDTHAIPRGKWLPACSAAKIWQSGVSLPRSIFALDIWGREVTSTGLHLDCGDIDGLCHPIPATLAPVPWSGGKAAQVLLTMSQGGAPCGLDPRQCASAALGRLAQLGLKPVVAFELEFYLFRPWDAGSREGPQPIASTPSDPAPQNMYGLDDLDAVEPFLSAVREAAAAQNVAADSVLSEAAPGQFEINLRHQKDGLRAADEAVLLRRIIAACAKQHGLRASFMPKPLLDQAGSGMHAHVSLLDRSGQNIFAPEIAGDRLLHHAVAGLLATMRDFTLLFVPGLNGFRRITPDSYAPTWPSWGEDNRSVAVRIPMGDRENRRIEHRISGADANPYLVLAALLHGMARGLEEKMDAPPPVRGSAYARDGEALPPSMSAAIDIFASSEVVRSSLGAAFQEMFVKLKQAELAEFQNRITDLEYRSYL